MDVWTPNHRKLALLEKRGRIIKLEVPYFSHLSIGVLQEFHGQFIK